MTDANPTGDVMRLHAERQYAGELETLAAQDDRLRPPGWRLSPWAVRTFLMGGKLGGKLNPSKSCVRRFDFPAPDQVTSASGAFRYADCGGRPRGCPR